jgi:hypothetical protein
VIHDPSEFYVSWYENWLIHRCRDNLDPLGNGAVNWEPNSKGQHKCDKCKKLVDPRIIFFFNLKEFSKPTALSPQQFKEYNRDP